MQRLLALLLSLLLATACTGEAQVAETAAPDPAPGAAGTVGPGAAPADPVAPSPSPRPTPPTPAGWQPLAPAPLALSEVAGAAHEGRMWTAGGLTAEGAGGQAVQVYDPAADAWSAGPDLPVPVHHAALVSDGERLLLVGGYEGSDFAAPTAAVWVLDEGGQGWVPGPSLPEPRAAGAAASDGTAVVYGGGVGPIGLASEVWRLQGEGWVRIGLLSTPREHLAAAGAAGVVWFMGGRSGGLDTNVGRVDVVVGGTVMTLGDVLPASGGVSGFATADGRGCMVGGEDPDVARAAVACVDVAGVVTALPDLALPRHGLAVAAVGDRAYVGMGGPQPGLFVSDALEVLPLPGG